jgi:type II restriction enzyme
MILKSRAIYKSSEDFKNEFLNTLTPGIILRSDFIHWESIKKKIAYHKNHLEFYKTFTGLQENRLKDELRDSLLAHDDPTQVIRAGFELFAHTGERFVTFEDNLDLKLVSEKIKNENYISNVSKLFVDLGLEEIIEKEIDDYFLGVQVGLETHRRKNVGGNVFKTMMAIELQQAIISLKEAGFDFKLTEEEKILYMDGQTSKTVDFCLVGEKLKIGIEVNFYTASGSKPTEIKRSYGQVNRDLEGVNAALIWVTDGAGYIDMKKSLMEAKEAHPNIYNFHMFKEHFVDDIKTLCGTTKINSSQ